MTKAGHCSTQQSETEFGNLWKKWPQIWSWLLQILSHLFIDIWLLYQLQQFNFLRCVIWTGFSYCKSLKMCKLSSILLCRTGCRKEWWAQHGQLHNLFLKRTFHSVVEQRETGVTQKETNSSGILLINLDFFHYMTLTEWEFWKSWGRMHY